MSRKKIAKNLKKALLDDGPMARALFEFELEEHLDEYLLSKHTDGDKFFFVVTEHTNHVAMLLIDEDDQIHINEAARTLLKKLWRDAYRENIQLMIPDMAEQLEAGYLYAAGVKEIDGLDLSALRS